MVAVKICFSVQDTHRKKTLSNETPVLTKSMNTDIWVVGTSNQLFVIRGSSTETKLSKFFVTGPFCTPHCIAFCK